MSNSVIIAKLISLLNRPINALEVMFSPILRFHIRKHRELLWLSQQLMNLPILINFVFLHQLIKIFLRLLIPLLFIVFELPFDNFNYS